MVDYGCGGGDLFSFLSDYGEKFSYLGLDQSATMIDFAKSRYQADFMKINFDEVAFDAADYVYASGIFQFADLDEPNYFERMVRDLYAKCKKAVGVNFLSELRSESEKIPSELYLNPEQLVQLARSVTSDWALDHSYHPGSGDVTLALFRKQDSAIWHRPRE